MHLLQRSSVFGAGNNKNKALRRVGSSPRAAPRVMVSRSESIKKKKSGGNKKGGGGGGVKQHGSRRARLRAGLAAALQELRLAAAGHRKRGGVSATARLPADHQAVGAPCCSDGVASRLAEHEAMRSKGSVTGGSVLPLLLLVLALACVVALGKAPAVCCCTCAAWWCRSSSAVSADERRRVVVLGSDDVVRLRPQLGASSITSCAARQRC